MRIISFFSTVIAIIFVLVFYFIYSSSTNKRDTHEDPKLAFKYFSKSMKMISSHFNKGIATLGYLDEVHKGVVTLDYLNEVENTKSIIFKKK